MPMLHSTPSTTGMLANCKDFWSKGADLAIDYPRSTIYPPKSARPLRYAAVYYRLAKRRFGPLAQLGLRAAAYIHRRGRRRRQTGTWSMWSSIRSQRPLLPTAHTNE